MTKNILYINFISFYIKYWRIIHLFLNLIIFFVLTLLLNTYNYAECVGEEDKKAWFGFGPRFDTSKPYHPEYGFDQWALANAQSGQKHLELLAATESDETKRTIYENEAQKLDLKIQTTQKEATKTAYEQMTGYKPSDDSSFACDLEKQETLSKEDNIPDNLKMDGESIMKRYSETIRECSSTKELIEKSFNFIEKTVPEQYLVMDYKEKEHPITSYMLLFKGYKVKTTEEGENFIKFNANVVAYCMGIITNVFDNPEELEKIYTSHYKQLINKHMQANLE